MPVAAPGASRWFSTTARLKRPGQPQPSANATTAPATKAADGARGHQQVAGRPGHEQQHDRAVAVVAPPVGACAERTCARPGSRRCRAPPASPAVPSAMPGVHRRGDQIRAERVRAAAASAAPTARKSSSRETRGGGSRSAGAWSRTMPPLRATSATASTQPAADRERDTPAEREGEQRERQAAHEDRPGDRRLLDAEREPLAVERHRSAMNRLIAGWFTALASPATASSANTTASEPREHGRSRTGRRR